MIYRNKIKDAEVTSTSFVDGCEAFYLKDERTFSKWKSKSETGGELKIKFSVPTYISAISLIGHNLGSVKASVTIEKSSDGMSYDTVLDAFKVKSNTAIVKILEKSELKTALLSEDGTPLLGEGGSPFYSETGSDITSQYWRIKIISTGAPEISVLYFGEYFHFEYPPEIPTVPISESIVSESAVSEGGHLLGTDFRYVKKTANYRFADLSREWYDNEYLKFLNYAKKLNPFVFAWDLENRKNDVLYSRFSANASIQENLTMLKFSDEINLDLEVLA